MERRIWLAPAIEQGMKAISAADPPNVRFISGYSRGSGGTNTSQRAGLKVRMAFYNISVLGGSKELVRKLQKKLM